MLAKHLLYQMSYTPIIGTPNRIRTGVAAVKGQCPRPLDDGCLFWRLSRESNPGPQFWRLMCYRNTYETKWTQIFKEQFCQ